MEMIWVILLGVISVIGIVIYFRCSEKKEDEPIITYLSYEPPVVPPVFEI